MSRGLLGGALGAGAATVYLKPEIVQDWAKEVVFGPRSSSVTLGASKELEQLQRLVSRDQCRSPFVPAVACSALPARS
jgi:hypothetical protein